MEKSEILSKLKKKPDGRPVIISGPCSAESEEQVLATAGALAQYGIDIFRAGIWKPRTMPGSFEGYGEKALPWLVKAKETFGLRTGTEVATPYHIEKALKAGIDVLWIGARTTANPFAVQEAAEALRGTGVPVLVKNPVNPDLELWIGSVERFIRSSANVAGVIHRGFSSFGKTKYRNMPYWSIPMEFRRRMPQLPMICDPSHIGGRRDLVQEISVHAMNLNFEGLFIESHINPDTALSDRNQQILPEQLGKIIAGLAPLAGNSRDSLLNSYREEIDAIDEQLLSLLSKRMHISKEIGKYKKQHAISVFQQARYEHIIKERIRSGTEAGLDRNFIERIMRELHEESVRVQMEIVDAEDSK